MIGHTRHELWALRVRWDAFTRHLVRAAACLWRCRSRAAQRRELLELDERLLRDIGISREDAQQEAAKRFWR